MPTQRLMQEGAATGTCGCENWKVGNIADMLFVVRSQNDWHTTAMLVQDTLTSPDILIPGKLANV